MAGNSEKGKMLFLATSMSKTHDIQRVIPQSIFISYTPGFIAVMLAYALVLATPHAFALMLCTFLQQPYIMHV